MVSSGHYWIYIRDFDRGIWRKYNDEYVQEAKEEDIYDTQPTIKPATPYFLVYVKDDQRKELVDAVCRDVQELPQEPQQDIIMEDEDNNYATVQPDPWTTDSYADDDITKPNGLWNAESQSLPRTVW